MAKTLKVWNGRGHGDYNRSHFYVAAYTNKEACELIGKAAGYDRSIGASELKNYYSKNCWGTPMAGITPTEPCVYAQERNETPVRIV
jgi:hypothetical protein